MTPLEELVRGEFKDKLDAIGVYNYHFVARDPDDMSTHFLRGSSLEWVYGTLTKEIKEIEYLWECESESMWKPDET